MTYFIDFGVWIDPKGCVRYVNWTHAEWAYRNPELSGLDPVFLSTASNERIVRALVERGWVRLRRSASHWNYTCNGTPEAESRLRGFFTLVLRQAVFGYRERNADVVMQSGWDEEGIKIGEFVGGGEASELTVEG